MNSSNHQHVYLVQKNLSLTIPLYIAYIIPKWCNPHVLQKKHNNENETYVGAGRKLVFNNALSNMLIKPGATGK